MRPLVWFRSDLRVRDNTALSAACDAADGEVVAAFALSARQWRAHDWAPAKIDFLLRNLAELSRELAEMHIPLVIADAPRFDDVPAELLKLAREHSLDGVWFNREYEVNERRRDAEVTAVFERDGRSVHAFTDQVVLPPASIRTGQGRFYTVFTPFKRSWIEAVKDAGGVSCLRKPRPRKRTRIAAGVVPREIPGFDGPRPPDLWKAGEAHARSRLRAFIEGRIRSYHEQRDLPHRNGTSTLSPYLAIGVLSPRQCLRAALAANGNRLDSGSKGVTTWISELVWREFYRHVLVGFPRVSMDDPFDLRTRGIRWRESDEDLERWKAGQTGIPIVDAGMRQLAATGWMHNRLRMVVAMFLSKNLFLDWRLGERHFMQNLIDGDLANNNGGWQWSASVGTDAAPYFRIFNPVSQSERYDPDGAFIREFVPELECLGGKVIHMPSERAPEVVKGLDYPRPIVDLKGSRERAIRLFREGTARAR